MSFEERVEKAIPSGMIYMFASIDNSQRPIGNSTQLPDPKGKSGGACTSALLQTLWQDTDEEDDDDEPVRYTWLETIESMKEKVADLGLTQQPQLLTSRPINAVDEEACIVPPYCEGVKRALLMGVNYAGQRNKLSSCHSDVRNMKQFLMQVHGLQRENMLIIMDDGNHHEPTKQLFLDGLRRLCEISRPGDSIFVQFSGTGMVLLKDRKTSRC
jgi:hypothetical protein